MLAGSKWEAEAMQSPFDREHADAWSHDFADVESLNARACDAILKVIDAARESSRRAPDQLRSHGLLVLGPAGAGKTHLFARLRKKCGPHAAFVLMRPELASDPTPRSVLGACMDALNRRVSGSDQRQMDLVVGSALAMIEGRGVKWPNAFLDELKSTTRDRRKEMVSRAVDQIADLFDDVDGSWLERFILLPIVSSTDRRAAHTWLSGREPDASQLERLGLKEPLAESSVLPALRTLAIIASYSTPIVLVFDQLENLVDTDDPTARRVNAHALLYSELFDTVRGLVLVQMALDSEWTQRIRPKLSQSQRDRLESTIQMLELPSSKQREALLAAWVDKLPVAERRPEPWPFTRDAWDRWRLGPGVTPRMLMIACREALAHPEDAVAEPTEPAPPLQADAIAQIETESRLAELWEEQLSGARRDMGEAVDQARPLDRRRLLGGIISALRLRDDTVIEPPKSREHHDARITIAGRTVELFVVQHGHPRWAAEALARATQIAKDRPVVAVRERARPFPPTWVKATDQLQAFEREPNAIWVELPASEVVELLAVHDLLSSARSRDLTDRDGRPLDEKVVHEWAKTRMAPEAIRVVGAVLGSKVEDEMGSVPLTALAPPIRLSTPPVPITRPPKKIEEPPLITEEEWAFEVTGPEAAGIVNQVLTKLRLASVDRLTREVRLRTKDASKTLVLDALRYLGPRVRWFGRSIVVSNEEAR
jgi:hypothetical protein